MPDPTTPAKNLTQPTVGGDNNTWGGLLNTDLALIDSALGGTVGISISGSITLNGTQIENTGYEFSGTLFAPAEITWPTFSGIAAIQNETTGGYSILCTVSGGTPVTILNGETVALWSNGTNFYRLAQVGGGGVVTNSDLQNSSIVIAGHTVSLGGSQNLAASDLTNGTTGTGDVVLATSPTISVTATGGSTAATLAARFGHILNLVDDFGADPTGVVDSAPAFKAAAVATPGGTVYCPPGVYLWNTAQTFTSTAYCTFVGAGWNERNGTNGTEAPTGTWIKITNTAIAPITFNYSGDGNTGGFVGFGFEQTHSTTFAYGWTPTVYQPVITILDAGTVILENIYWYGIYDCISIPGTSGACGRLRMDHMWGQPFNNFITATLVEDVIHADDLHFWPFWNSDQYVVGWQQSNATLLNLARVDGWQSDHIFCFGYGVGVSLGSDINGVTTNFYCGNFYCDATGIAVEVTGNLTNGSIGTLTHAASAWGGTGTTSAATTSGATLHFAAGTPPGIGIGATVTDNTTTGVIPGGTTVLAIGPTTVTMTANVTGGGVQSGDTITFVGGALPGSWGYLDTSASSTFSIDRMWENMLSNAAVGVNGASGVSRIDIGSAFVSNYNQLNDNIPAFLIGTGSNTQIIALHSWPLIGGSNNGGAVGKVFSSGAGSYITNVWLPWTPTVGGTSGAGSATYTLQQAEFLVAGSKIDYRGQVNFSALSGAAGDIVINGAPITIGGSGSTTGNWGVMGYWEATLDSGYTQLTVALAGGSNVIQVIESGSGNPSQEISVSKFTGSGPFVFAFSVAAELY
jgi:hypothetical protein